MNNYSILINKLILIPIFVIGCTSTSTSTSTLPQATLVIRDISIVDVVTGFISDHQSVLIDGNQITEIGHTADVQIPDHAKVVNGSGHYLIPGLWDMHVHITDATELALPVLLANGVTGIRDAGGDFVLLQKFETERAAGLRQVPRIFMAGPYVDSDKGLPYRVVVETANDGIAAANMLFNTGVDFIKIHNGVPREAYFSLMSKANALGIQVVGHIPLDVAPEDAVEAGQDGVEHFVSIFEGTLRQQFADDPEDLLQQYVSEDLHTLMELFAENNVSFTPTVYSYFIRAQRGMLANHPDPRLRYVSPVLQRQWDEWYPVNERDSEPEIVAGRTRFYNTGLDVVRVAQEAGVTILAGTDLAARDILPGFHLHNELEAMVEAGLSPLQALQTATLNPTRVLQQIDILGTIEEGKLADLLILEANPLENISNTQSIRGVVSDGKYYSYIELIELLNQVEKSVYDL